jgi:hypothetical protein
MSAPNPPLERSGAGTALKWRGRRLAPAAQPAESLEDKKCRPSDLPDKWARAAFQRVANAMIVLEPRSVSLRVCHGLLGYGSGA